MSENTDGFATAEQRDLVQTLATLCQAKQQVVATAESCTGGMIAAAMTHLAGSSAWFDCGFVTYSNNAKMNLLGVSGATLRAGPAGCYQKHYLIPGNRDEIRQQVVVEAIGGLINCINSVA